MCCTAWQTQPCGAKTCWRRVGAACSGLPAACMRLPACPAADALSLLMLLPLEVGCCLPGPALACCLAGVPCEGCIPFLQLRLVGLGSAGSLSALPHPLTLPAASRPLPPLPRQTLLSQHGVVCVSRAGSDTPRLLDRPGTLLNTYRHNIALVEEPVPNEISSSRVGGWLGAAGCCRVLPGAAGCCRMLVVDLCGFVGRVWAMVSWEQVDRMCGGSRSSLLPARFSGTSISLPAAPLLLLAGAPRAGAGPLCALPLAGVSSSLHLPAWPVQHRRATAPPPAAPLRRAKGGL